VIFPEVTVAPVSRLVTRVLAENGRPARGVSGTTTTVDAESRTADPANAAGAVETTSRIRISRRIG
jgi:hypothetical protein